VVDLAIGRRDSGHGVEVVGLDRDLELGADLLPLPHGGAGHEPVHVVVDHGVVQALREERAASAGLGGPGDKDGAGLALGAWSCAGERLLEQRVAEDIGGGDAVGGDAGHGHGHVGVFLLCGPARAQ